MQVKYLKNLTVLGRGEEVRGTQREVPSASLALGSWRLGELFPGRAAADPIRCWVASTISPLPLPTLLFQGISVVIHHKLILEKQQAWGVL